MQCSEKRPFQIQERPVRWSVCLLQISHYISGVSGFQIYTFREQIAAEACNTLNTAEKINHLMDVIAAKVKREAAAVM